MRFGRIGSDKNNKKEARKREVNLAKELGGRATPNSGATDGAKGDISFGKYLLDDKFTSKPAYSVTVPTLSKITREAYAVGKYPLLSINIRKGITKGYPDTWILVPISEIELESQKTTEVQANSYLVSAQILNSIYKTSLREQTMPCVILQFYKVPLGVSNKWYLLPLENLKDRGFFDAN